MTTPSSGQGTGRQSPSTEPGHRQALAIPTKPWWSTAGGFGPLVVFCILDAQNSTLSNFLCMFWFVIFFAMTWIFQNGMVLWNVPALSIFHVCFVSWSCHFCAFGARKRSNILWTNAKCCCKVRYLSWQEVLRQSARNRVNIKYAGFMAFMSKKGWEKMRNAVVKPLIHFAGLGGGLHT